MAGAWTSQNALVQSPVETECGTYLPEHNPQVQAQSAALRQLTRRVSAGQQQPMGATVTIIPVVVHLIHDYSPGTNITRAKVLDGMRMLNDDLNYRNPASLSDWENGEALVFFRSVPQPGLDRAGRPGHGPRAAARIFAPHAPPDA